MFYEISNELREIAPDCICPDRLTVGCLSCDELPQYAKLFGFNDETVAASQSANPLFRTGADVHEDYTFTELRIVNPDGHEDFISVFIKHNLLLIVDIIDEDGSTVNCFLKALRKFPIQKIGSERLLFSFIESLLSDGNAIAEGLRNRLTEMEESIVKGETDENFNADLLELKKTILKFTNFYEQILDVSETLEENENEILDEDKLFYITNLSNKVTRLSNDMKLLSSAADHIQDAYATLLDQRMNNTMKTFTILTSIFFPLTIIVGWYGMNFKYMPELDSPASYPIVIGVCLAIAAACLIYFKRKKWL